MRGERPGMSDAYLQQFEKRRLSIESQLLRMPTSAHIVQRFGGTNGIGQQYLHALPTMCTLIEFVGKSPRTGGTFTDRVLRFGQCKIREHEIEKAFVCFGLGYLYRNIYKRTNDAEMASLLSRVATLSLLSPADLEKIDWVTKSFSATTPNGVKDPLAPAHLLMWWLMGGEHPQRTQTVDQMLLLYFDFLKVSLDLALRHQINMNFPW